MIQTLRLSLSSQEGIEKTKTFSQNSRKQRADF